MDNSVKTRDELIQELQEMRQRIASLDSLEYELEQCKDRLQQCETKHRSLLDSSPDPMVVYDTSGHALYVNPAFTRTFGWSEDEVLGKRIDYVPEEFTSQTKETLEKLFKGEQVPSFDTRRLTKDGLVLDIHISSALFKDIGGEPVGHIVTLRDVTDERQAEEALRKSEGLLSAVLDALPDVVGVQLPDHTITRYNRAGYELLGLEPAEINGRKCYESIGRREPCQPCATSRAVRSKKMECLEKYVPELDRHFLCASSPLLDANGEVRLVIERLTDITERKRMESRLRDSEERFKALFENMGNAVAVYRAENDGEDFIFLDFNQAGETIEGTSRDQVIGKSLLEAFPAVKEFGLFDVFQRVWRTGESEHHPVTLYRDDRIEGWRDNFVYKLPAGEIVAVYSDETARMKTYETLRESEARYRRIVETANEGIWLIDAEGKTTFVNKTMAEMLGCSPEEMIGRNLFDFMEEEEVAQAKTLLRRRREGIAEQHDFKFCRKDGFELWTIISTNPIFDQSGEFLGALGMITDITERKKAEEALRESQQMLLTVLDTIPVAVFWKDRESVYMGGNKEWLKAAGLTSSEEVVGKSDYDLPWEKSQANGFREDDKRVMEAGVPVFNIIERYLRADGTQRWARTNKVPIRDRLGGVVGLLGTYEDITERKKAEDALRSSEDLYKTLAEHTSVGIWQIDRNEVTIFMNRVMCEMLEIDSPEELVGRTYHSFFTQESLERIEREHAKREEGESSVYEVEIKGKRGTRRTVAVSGAPLFSANGSLESTIGTFMDITEIRRTQEALRESEEKYRSLVLHVPIGIISSDTGGRITEVNPWLLDILGSPSPEATKSINMLTFPPLVEAGISDAFKRCMQEGRKVELETPYTSKWGKSSYLRVILTPRLDSGGNVQAFQAAVEDITDRKRLEEHLLQAQKMEAVGTLAGGIAHDFNNLLQIISGHAELLEMELAQRGMRFSDMDAIRQSADRGADLVKQILTFSRRVDTKFEHINLNEDVKSAERLLYRTIPKMIEIELKLEEELRPVQADSNQVEQMLINLAVNAKDAMPDGGKLTITTQNVQVENQFCGECGGHFTGQYVLLRVSDTGHGMSEDVLQHIFEPFFTTKGLADGTGLGLSTVFGIVKMHSGHISCESEVGKGTTFSMYFPAAEEAKPDTEPERKATPIAGGTETILVVDDEPMISELAKRILTNAGYSVLTVGSGKEALQIYAQQKSDIALVILDLIMPEMGGEECLKELLKIDPQVKALIASGLAISGDTKTFLDTEAKGKVAKPFNTRDLLRSVRHVLDGA